MTDQDGTRRLLSVVPSFLLGLTIALLLAWAANTLYAAPKASLVELRQLQEQQKSLEAARRVTGTLPGTHEQLYQRLVNKVATAKKVVQAERGTWSRNSAIALVALAVLIMGASLALARTTSMLSTGLLLGGIATAVYGVLRAFAGSSSGVRLALAAVAAVAIVVSVYVRFVRLGSVEAGTSATAEAVPATPLED